MIRTQEHIHTFKCPYCGHDKAKQVIHEEREIAHLQDPESMKDSVCTRGVTTATSIECSQCRHSWSSAGEAMKENAFPLVKSRSLQDCCWIVHMSLEPHPRRKPIFQEYGDAVKCSYCQWTGLVEVGEHRCPNCFQEGMLKWQHPEKHEAHSFVAAYSVLPERKE